VYQNIKSISIFFFSQIKNIFIVSHMAPRPTPKGVKGIYPAPTDTESDRFLLHSSQGFHLWRNENSEKLLPYEESAVENTASASDTGVIFAVSSTRWKRLPFDENAESQGPLEFSRDTHRAHAGGVLALESGCIQWVDMEVKHEVPYVAGAAEVTLCPMSPTVCIVLVLLNKKSEKTSSSKSVPNNGDNIALLTVDKDKGLVGKPMIISQAVLAAWPTRALAWKEGIVCDNSVLRVESRQVSLSGTLPGSQFLLVRGDVSVEFRHSKKGSHKIETTIRNLRFGNIIGETVFILEAVPTMGAMTDTHFLISSEKGAISKAINPKKRMRMSDLCTLRSQKKPKVWEFWTTAEDVDRVLSSGETPNESLIEKTKTWNNEKTVDRILSDISKGNRISKGFLYILEKADMQEVCFELMQQENIDETDRVALVSYFPSLILPLMKKSAYSSDAMRSALRAMPPETVEKILRYLQLILKAYYFVGPRLRIEAEAVDLYLPSYENVLRLLELIVDARLMDLALTGSPECILGLEKILGQSAKAQSHAEKLHGAINALRDHQPSKPTEDPIEIWHIPF